MSNKTVLLSIRPWWADAILRGEKKWEYRKKPPGISPPYDMILYATEPEQKLVGEVTVVDELRDNVENVIKMTIDQTPHEPEDIREYFGDAREACALKIGDELKTFKNPLELNQHPPMNFQYVDREEILG